MRTYYVDEYGSLWTGIPGASKRVGDLIPQSGDNGGTVYLVTIEEEQA